MLFKFLKKKEMPAGAGKTQGRTRHSIGILKMLFSREHDNFVLHLHRKQSSVLGFILIATIEGIGQSPVWNVTTI